MVLIASFFILGTAMNLRMFMLNVGGRRQNSGLIQYDCRIAVDNRNEINRIQRLIEENKKMLLQKWNDYFSD
jgi:hypothetical protein